MPRRMSFSCPVIVIAALAAITASTTGHAAAAGPIAGKWATDDGKAIIEIAPCGVQYCGRITRFLVPEPVGGARDGKNPNKALRTRKLLGLAILTGLQRDGGRWAGKGYSPEEGRNFNAALTPVGDTLRVKGCVAFFCRTVVWKRAR